MICRRGRQPRRPYSSSRSRNRRARSSWNISWEFSNRASNSSALDASFPSDCILETTSRWRTMTECPIRTWRRASEMRASRAANMRRSPARGGSASGLSATDAYGTEPKPVIGQQWTQCQLFASPFQIPLARCFPPRRSPGAAMLARIGVMRALNRHVERVFNPDRKGTHWGKRKLKRDQ